MIPTHSTTSDQDLIISYYLNWGQIKDDSHENLFLIAKSAMISFSRIQVQKALQNPINNSDICLSSEKIRNLLKEKTKKSDKAKFLFCKSFSLEKKVKAISLNPFQNITKLNLSHLSLPCLPPELKHLHLLEELNANENQIKWFPRWINDLPNLLRLTLRGNEIAFIPAVDNLKQLQWLDLSHNRLKEIDQSISACQRLSTLILRGNQFSQIPSTLFNLKKLKVLNLSLNAIDSISNQVLTMKKLKALILSDNPIKKIDPKFLKHFSEQNSFYDTRYIKGVGESLIILKSPKKYFFKKHIS